MTTGMRAALAITLVASGTGLGAVWRLEGDRETTRQRAIETSRIRGWARSEGGAGPSVLPKRVPFADPAELRGLEDLPGFHAYAMRCSSCHRLPDPAAYRAGRWIGKVDEMREYVDRAGVVPAPDDEIEAVTRFLGAASDSLRQE